MCARQQPWLIPRGAGRGRTHQFYTNFEEKLKTLKQKATDYVLARQMEARMHLTYVAAQQTWTDGPGTATHTDEPRTQPPPPTQRPHPSIFWRRPTNSDIQASAGATRVVPDSTSSFGAPPAQGTAPGYGGQPGYASYGSQPNAGAAQAAAFFGPTPPVPAPRSFPPGNNASAPPNNPAYPRQFQ